MQQHVLRPSRIAVPAECAYFDTKARDLGPECLERLTPGELGVLPLGIAPNEE